LPTEAQKIDRMLSAFSSWWFCSSIDSTHGVEEPVVKSAEAAYVMSYSVLMLNTDLFNDAIRPENRMSMDDFIRANVGVNDGDNLPVAMLADIYTNVAAHEIQSTTSTAAMQQGTDDTIMHVPEADGEAADDAPQVDETRQQRGYWVIFFDVDGVLNTTQPDSPSMGIEPPLLANLQRLAAAHRRPPPAVLDDHPVLGLEAGGGADREGAAGAGGCRVALWGHGGASIGQASGDQAVAGGESPPHEGTRAGGGSSAELARD
jgi:hypothetical protein